MCLIIASPLGKLPKKREVKNAELHNPDGFGIVYLDRNQELQMQHSFNSNRTAWELLQVAEGSPYVLHFRFATHGNIDATNVHPFEVIPKKLYVAHNGVLNIPIADDNTKSDTWHFVEKILKPLRTKIHQKAVLEQIGKAIGYNNKLAFINNLGKIQFVNESAGEWDREIWFSNEYSTYSPYGGNWKDEDYLCELENEEVPEVIAHGAFTVKDRRRFVELSLIADDDDQYYRNLNRKYIRNYTPGRRFEGI